ncbi:DUF192 domain-containing protein [Psychroflexus aestuariivivens]|uniref:DUF192 domain-containing protein n=1 Tax=Psychroflexus aestuariivivens TaxID=1795040 RepID=UPI000FDA6AAF|nr:DUF192 domain-containing protein [Psychroflexus aestuariivivens]
MNSLKALIIISIGLFFYACKTESKSENLNKPITFQKDTSLVFIQNKDTLSPVFDTELADSDYKKEIGLMHRSEIENNQGMLFIYEDEKPRPNFYMKNTLVSLDLIYLNSNFEIVDFNLNTTPEDESSIPSEAPSKYVLEVKSGTVENLNLDKNTRVFLK